MGLKNAPPIISDSEDQSYGYTENLSQNKTPLNSTKTSMVTATFERKNKSPGNVENGGGGGGSYKLLLQQSQEARSVTPTTDIQSLDVEQSGVTNAKLGGDDSKSIQTAKRRRLSMGMRTTHAVCGKPGKSGIVSITTDSEIVDLQAIQKEGLLEHSQEVGAVSNVTTTPLLKKPAAEMPADPTSTGKQQRLSAHGSRQSLRSLTSQRRRSRTMSVTTAVDDGDGDGDDCMPATQRETPLVCDEEAGLLSSQRKMPFDASINENEAMETTGDKRQNGRWLEPSLARAKGHSKNLAQHKNVPLLDECFSEGECLPATQPMSMDDDDDQPGSTDPTKIENETPTPIRRGYSRMLTRATVVQPQSQRSLVKQANSWLLTALSNPKSIEASFVELRPGLQAACDQIIENVAATVEAGHNNSLLVMGPRGCGKTLAVERALAVASAKYNGQMNAQKKPLSIVRLVGWAHSESKIGFQEIARQLCVCLDLSYSRGASLQDNIEFVTMSLKKLVRAQRSVIFILEEFDLFAKTIKQTLLYNLLDALQTSGVKAAVIGLTVRQDAVDLLEKRVKSRFSHRRLDILPPDTMKRKMEEGMADELKRSAFSEDKGGPLPEDTSLDVLRAMLTLPPAFDNKEYAHAHNTAVNKAIKDPAVRLRLQKYVTIHSSMRSLGNVVELALCMDTLKKNGLITPTTITEAIRLIEDRDDDIKFTIGGLSILELIVLVAMHRLTIKRAATEGIFNYEMVCREAEKYTRTDNHVDTYQREAVGRAFDRLIGLGLAAMVVGAGGRSSGAVGRRYGGVQLQVRDDEIREGIRVHWNCPTLLETWFEKEGGLVTTAGATL